jgi:FMN-dependent NADH-azoreductase
MYNFTIPAVLKSWIDYVIRPGFTFRLAPGWPGMLENKKAQLIVVSGILTRQASPAKRQTWSRLCCGRR